jgi:hypothetical protein
MAQLRWRCVSNFMLQRCGADLRQEFADQTSHALAADERFFT